MTRNSLAHAYLRNGTLTLAALSALGWAFIYWSVANMSSPLVALVMLMTAKWEIKEMAAVK